MKAKECRDCGEEIEKGRAAALPFAETCVHCQRIREANGRFVRHKIDIQASCKAGEIEEVHETLVRGSAI